MAVAEGVADWRVWLKRRVWLTGSVAGAEGVADQRLWLSRLGSCSRLVISFPMFFSVDVCVH